MNVDNKDYKKQQVMVDNFKDMVDKGLRKWRFVMATSIHDTNDSAFQKMIESAKGYPIEFVINKPNKKLWEIYNKAKIYWHASGFGEDLAVHPEYAEHFGISTVEAMGAGVVPVVINSGGQREIVTHGVDGMLWNTLEEQQQYTHKLIENHKLLATLAAAAKKRADDFSYEKFCEHVEELVHFS